MGLGEKRSDHLAEEEKYSAIREITYSETMKEFPDIQVKGLSFVDALEADRWKEITSYKNRIERSSWAWAKEFPHYQRRPNRFEVTLSRGGILCALCYGQLSKKGSTMRMNLIESTPVRPTPMGMKALPVLSFAAAIFSDITGADELWVLDPASSLESVYNREGFGNREIYHGSRFGQRRIL